MPTVKLEAWERRSRTERYFENELKKRNIKYSYEPITVVLIPELKGTFGTHAATTYTPDFKLEIDGKIIWVETKGFARARDHLIFKLADWFFTKRGESYIVVGHFGAKTYGTRGFYRYKYKNVISRFDKWIKKGDKKVEELNLPPTFFEELDELLDKIKENK